MFLLFESLAAWTDIFIFQTKLEKKWQGKLIRHRVASAQKQVLLVGEEQVLLACSYASSHVFFCKSKNSYHASFILPKPCFIDHLALSLLYMLTAIFFGTM